jgi:hypothetical protein
MGREAWARGLRVAALGGIAYGGISGVVSRLVVAPLVAIEFMLVYGAIAFLVLAPLCALGFYCAARWVGLQPAPWLWAREEPAWRLPVIGLVAAAILFVGSIALAVAFAPLLQGGTGPIDQLSQLSVAGRLVVSSTAFWEEAVFRLAIFFPVAALLGVRGADRRKPPPLAVWIAVLASGLLFALAHIGNITGAGAQGYLLFSLVQKGLFVSGVLGYLTWRWGLESAVIAHFGLDAMALLI